MAKPNKAPDILKALYDTADTTSVMQSSARKLIKSMLKPEYLMTLTFEQQMRIFDATMHAQNVAHKFIIDFYTANQKSEGISRVLELALGQTARLDGDIIEAQLGPSDDASAQTARLIKQQLQTAIKKKIKGQMDGGLDG